MLHGIHLIKAWTKQQSVVATSTEEAELYAGNRAAAVSMGVQAFAKDLGGVVPIRLHVDSSAALSIISRIDRRVAEDNATTTAAIDVGTGWSLLVQWTSVVYTSWFVPVVRPHA